MILKNGFVFYEGKFQRLDIEIKERHIYNISSDIKGKNEIDINGMKVIPGIVDIHTHGCMGYDFTRARKDEINTMLKYYMSNGITSILATVMTDSKDNLEKAMKELKRFIYKEDELIETCMPTNDIVKGINLEGPFFGEDKKGAHDSKYLREIDEAFFDALNFNSGNNIKIITIDPTLNGYKEFMQKYSQKLTVSVGHTNCDYKTGSEAIKVGAKHITHLFNAMNGIHHRNPGLVGVFSDNNITGELICDGIHIDEAVIRMIYKIAGNRIAIISDSITPTGLKDGKYTSGGMNIVLKDNVAKLVNGTIAGSVTNCFEGMKNTIKYGVSEEHAIISATLIPAQIIGLDNRIGSIERGKIADIVVVDDKYDIKSVIKSGTVIEHVE